MGLCVQHLLVITVVTLTNPTDAFYLDWPWSGDAQVNTQFLESGDSLSNLQMNKVATLECHIFRDKSLPHFHLAKNLAHASCCHLITLPCHGADGAQADRCF